MADGNCGGTNKQTSKQKKSHRVKLQGWVSHWLWVCWDTRTGERTWPVRVTYWEQWAATCCPPCCGYVPPANHLEQCIPFLISGSCPLSRFGRFGVFFALFLLCFSSKQKNNSLTKAALVHLGELENGTGHQDPAVWCYCKRDVGRAREESYAE